MTTKTRQAIMYSGFNNAVYHLPFQSTLQGNRLFSIHAISYCKTTYEPVLEHFVNHGSSNGTV
jgi:hypothetical protein